MQSSLLKSTPGKILAGAAVAALTLVAPRAQATDFTQIQQALHADGVRMPGTVLHFDLVRSDISLTIAGQAVDPGVVANGYVNFTPVSGDTYYANGSLPAQETEVTALVDALRTDPNFQIASVVNHAAQDQPKLLWVHFEATGNDRELTKYIVKALAAIKNPQIGVTVIPAASQVQVPAQFQQLFKSGVFTQVGPDYVFSLPRPDESLYKLGNIAATPGLGVGQTFFIQVLNSGDQLTIGGELALRLDETGPVLNALRDAGFVVPAMHDHYVDDNPRLFYMHFFGSGDTTTLAEGLAKVVQLIHSH